MLDGLQQPIEAAIAETTLVCRLVVAAAAPTPVGGKICHGFFRRFGAFQSFPCTTQR
jgi:hypothetical protein